MLTPCEYCEGTGEMLEMVCYGGALHERRCDCLECNGAGEIEEIEIPIIDKLPKRIRDW